MAMAHFPVNRSIQPVVSSNPYACALGDVNNDNRLDVAVSDCYNGNVVVLLGDGDGSFSNIRSYSTGSYSCLTSVAFGDFNNDSILDIVVANYNTNMIDVFLGFTYINGVREGTLFNWILSASASCRSR